MGPKRIVYSNSGLPVRGSKRKQWKERLPVRDSKRKQWKERVLVRDDLEFKQLRAWLQTEHQRFEALNIDSVRESHEATVLLLELEDLIFKTERKFRYHIDNLESGKVVREWLRWHNGLRRLRVLMATIGHMNSNIEAIAATQEKRRVKAKLEKISSHTQDIALEIQGIRNRLEETQFQANEEERKHPEANSEKARLLESSAKQEDLTKLIAELDINLSRPDTIADLHSAACITLSFLSSLGDGIPYKGNRSYESASMDLKRWAVGFTKGELALDRILEGGGEGRQFLKACIVGALADIIQMEGNLLELLSESGFKEDSKMQNEKLKTMADNAKAILKRGDVISAAENQSVPGLEAEDGRENAEDGMDIFTSALDFIQQTTTSLFDLVPAIRNLRQEKLLHLQRLDGLDRAKEEPLAERRKRGEDDKGEQKLWDEGA